MSHTSFIQRYDIYPHLFSHTIHTYIRSTIPSIHIRSTIPSLNYHNHHIIIISSYHSTIPSHHSTIPSFTPSISIYSSIPAKHSTYHHHTILSSPYHHHLIISSPYHHHHLPSNHLRRCSVRPAVPSRLGNRNPRTRASEKLCGFFHKINYKVTSRHLGRS